MSLSSAWVSNEGRRGAQPAAHAAAGTNSPSFKILKLKFQATPPNGARSGGNALGQLPSTLAQGINDSTAQVESVGGASK
ncbi:hypothetical protein WMF26_24215 [Sorangium sp. So ce185]|uniref:hypothetical protein n=1 Tax=Sorangium sp. So ce185 TaxID=3133287 RepID=UPI003F5EAD28